MYEVLIKHGWDVSSDSPANALESVLMDDKRPKVELAKWMIAKGARPNTKEVADKLSELGVQVPKD